MTPLHITQACERAQNALILATTKPSPRGQGGGSTIEPPMPLPVGIISAKRELRDMLVDWVTMVSDPRDLDIVANCDRTETDMLRWLGEGERAEYLAAHDEAQQFLDELTTVTKQLENPYLPRNGYKYLGNVAGSPLYAKDGQHDVQLPDGQTMTVQAVKEHAANDLLNYEGTAQKVATIIETYFGHELKPAKIAATQKDDKRKKTGHKLEPVRTEGRDHIYLVSDVLERLCKK